MHVLVIDDELAVRQVIAAFVSKAGHSVDQAGSATEGAAKLARGDADVALCDIKMPDGSGIDLVRNSRAAGLDTVFLMVTAFASVETAVEALRAGAFDYIVKPVNHEELAHRLRQVEAMRGLREENKALRRVAGDIQSTLFSFASPAMVQVERLAGKVAPTDSTVLLTGESGTGKGVVARSIHERSGRATGPFLPVNCSAIPEQLLESEFFGHTKGAFTSADRPRRGLFLEADRGTLFLDEIGELPLHMQTKLLHVIEEKEFRPVGSDQPRKVDVRLIAATNRDLAAMVREGKFREDLYFRLAMFHIPLPPLRERQADLPALVHFVLGNLQKAAGARSVDIDPSAEEILVSYHWPGNVREVENILNRAYILADGHSITIADLPVEITRTDGGQGTGTAIAKEGYLRDQLRAVEANLVMRTLDEVQQDRRLAAQKLGIGLSSLYRKLEEFERQGLINPAAKTGMDSR